MSLKDFQEDFTNCCRGKDDSPLKEEKRIGVYKQFIYEKMEESLENAYPITLSLISKEVWKDMIVSFIREYPCDTPYYWRIPEQFLFFCTKKEACAAV